MKNSNDQHRLITLGMFFDTIRKLNDIGQRADIVQLSQRCQQWMRQFIAGTELAREWFRRAPRLVHQYCLPYQQQIASLEDVSISPLSSQEEWEFFISAALFARPDERILGQRPPLEVLAFLNNRLDLAATLLVRQREGLLKSVKPYETLPNQREERQGDVYLELRGRLLPTFEKMLKRSNLPLAMARRELEKLLSDQYLVACITRGLNRKRFRVKKQADLEFPFHEASNLTVESSVNDLPDAIAIEQCLKAYLDRSNNPELDRQIIQATFSHVSMAKLAKKIGRSERTLRDRSKKFRDYLKAALQEI